MYDRKVKDQTLTFAVSGLLWNSSLVMLDQETGSLWSHILGTCERGQLEGERLDMIPSLMTDWKTWRATHPKTTVLAMSRTTSDYRRWFYARPEIFVVGLAEGDVVRAWPFDQLQRQSIVNDKFGSEAVLVTFDPDSSTPAVFSRRVEDRTLAFEFRDGALRDRQTSSTWNATTGIAEAGPLAGQSLKPLPAIVSYRETWQVFHPKSTFWTASQK